MFYFTACGSTHKQWPREKSHTLKWPTIVKLMASKSSLTRVARSLLAPDPGATVAANPPLAPAAPRAVSAAGGATDHPPAAAAPRLIPGPALTPDATDLLPVVAVTTIAEMTVAAKPHHVATGPAPGPPATGTGTRTRGLRAPLPNPNPEPTAAAQDLDLQRILST